MCLFLSNYIVFDGFEHIKISYLVSEGYVPYRDFFEHHHHVNVYSKKISYYQLFSMMAQIDNILFNRYPDYDVNEFIETNKVKYLDYINIPKKYRDPSDFNEFSRFKISDETLSKYEEVEPALWRRKEEYQ